MPHVCHTFAVTCCPLQTSNGKPFLCCYDVHTRSCVWHIRPLCARRYSRRHSEVFVPPNSNVHYRASGMGSYTGMQGPLTQLADGVPLLDTLKRTGYTVNWDATFWWPYIMMIAPTLRPSVPGVYDNATELWGSSFDKVSGFNNRLSNVHVHASYAIR